MYKSKWINNFKELFPNNTIDWDKEVHYYIDPGYLIEHLGFKVIQENSDVKYQDHPNPSESIDMSNKTVKYTRYQGMPSTAIRFMLAHILGHIVQAKADELKRVSK